MLDIKKYRRGYGQPFPVEGLNVPSSVLIPPMIVSTIAHCLAELLGVALAGATVTTNRPVIVGSVLGGNFFTLP